MQVRPRSTGNDAPVVLVTLCVSGGYQPVIASTSGCAVEKAALRS